jgi:hypothetical protein
MPFSGALDVPLEASFADRQQPRDDIIAHLILPAITNTYRVAFRSGQLPTVGRQSRDGDDGDELAIDSSQHDAKWLRAWRMTSTARVAIIGFTSMSTLSCVLALVLAGQLTPAPEPIHGGEPAEPCQWPTAVALYENSVLCSGTLVHPRLVVTAAHCIGAGPGPSQITFGESVFEPARMVAVDHCRANPAATGELGFWDYAYCLLAEPVSDIAITPPLLGCETQVLTYGQEVVIAGYGATDDNESGIKHWGTTIVSSQAAGDTVVVGADGTAACSGDSGGSAFVQLGDGGWRAFGIVSGGLSCEEAVTYVTIHSMIGWAETETGLDFTPCHDADGTWNPGPECGEFASAAQSPELTATWPNCEGARTGKSATCGPAWASEGDVSPPSVAIVSPVDGAIFAEPMALLDVVIAADDGEGGGVEHVELVLVEGEVEMMIASDEQAPWLFVGASFPAGVWSLRARAVDWWGNAGSSAIVTVFVGPQPPSEETGSEDSESDSGGSTSDETGASLESSGAGRGCRAASPAAPRQVCALLLVLLACSARMRRSR